MKVGAAILVHNMAPLVGLVVRSLGWTDGVYLFDDHCDDGTVEVARQAATVPLVVEASTLPDLAFASGELIVRNYVCHRAFQALGLDVVCVVDADELLDGSIRPIIEQKIGEGYSSISMSTWHLIDKMTALRFRETTINGLRQTDPHVRIFTPKRQYTPLHFGQSHPIIEADNETWHTDGPYHFHLKYLPGSPYLNSSLWNLPERLTDIDREPFAVPLPFPLPEQVASAVDDLTWTVEANPLQRPRYGSHRQLVSRRETCRFYLGEAPCAPHERDGAVCDTCPDFTPSGQTILCLILGADAWFEAALAAALATVRHYPHARLFAVCEERHLLQTRAVPGVVRVEAGFPAAQAMVQATHFDIILALSDSPLGAQFAALACGRVKRGLVWTTDGRISAANIGAIGLLQHLAFPGASPIVTESTTLSALLAEACEEAAP